VDPFTYIVIGGMAGLIVALLLIGRYYPGSGADVLDWKPTRSVEVEAELELTDLDQMLEAQNERRRKRGLPDRTLEELEGEVAADLREQRTLREAYRTQRQAGGDLAAGGDPAAAGDLAAGGDPAAADLEQAERERDEQDLAELLALHNERRRRRGEPELTAAQLRSELEGGPPAGGDSLAGGGPSAGGDSSGRGGPSIGGDPPAGGDSSGGGDASAGGDRSRENGRPG
jgi:hypothetical protein